MFAAMMVVAMGLDALVGWPDTIYRQIGHPVTWLGALIRLCDQRMNRSDASDQIRRITGVFTALLVIGLALMIGVLIWWVVPSGLTGILIGGVLAWPLLAIRSMHDHVKAVSDPLLAGDTDAARDAVAMIVGRDPSQLDDAGIARAGLESLAENTSDGIVAPLFWGVIAGLPGIAAYKAVNTLDSMIGYRTPRHAAFGWASARIDDLANFIPARITGFLFALCSKHPRHALNIMIEDAHHHRSPNAGWPEAAFAGALGIRLSGPRTYGTTRTDDPWVNKTCPDPTAADFASGLALYRRSLWVLGLCLVLLAWGIGL